MRTFGAFEAKNRLSELLTLVEHGEEVIITKHGRPVARLVPADQPGRSQVLRAIEDVKRHSDALQLGGLDWKALRDEGRK